MNQIDFFYVCRKIFKVFEFWWKLLLTIYPKESTTLKLCHIDAFTVKSHLLAVVVKGITGSILVGSDLKMVTSLFYLQ